MAQEGKEKLITELTSLLSRAPPLVESGLYEIATDIGGERIFTILRHLAIKRMTQLLQAVPLEAGLSGTDLSCHAGMRHTAVICRPRSHCYHDDTTDRKFVPHHLGQDA